MAARDEGERMLDGKVRRFIDPVLDRIGAALAGHGASADLVTITAFVLGAGAAGLIVVESYLLALVMILLSRVLDGLDGAVARHTVPTDRGGFLDIVLDFAFYGLVPLAFVLARPEDNAAAGAVLLFSFYLNGSSFLGYAAIAEKRRLSSSARGVKSIYFTTGLAEATETILVFCLFCLFPDNFALIAYVFAAMCLVTAATRIVMAVRAFS
jgi:phosphatidylglycerophosphate synthase